MGQPMAPRPTKPVRSVCIRDLRCRIETGRKPHRGEVAQGYVRCRSQPCSDHTAAAMRIAPVVQHVQRGGVRRRLVDVLDRSPNPRQLPPRFMRRTSRLPLRRRQLHRPPLRASHGSRRRLLELDGSTPVREYAYAAKSFTPIYLLHTGDGCPVLC